MRSSRDQYEQAVISLTNLAARLRSEGQSDEAIARELVSQRNTLKAEFRAGLNPEIVERISARNLAKYGDALGPSPEALLEKYGDWAAVIEAAGRHADLNKDRLGASLMTRRQL